MDPIDLIQNTPIIRLSMAELRQLPEDDLSRALGHLFDMARNGDMTMLAVNQPGTTYDVGYDRERGWALRPICRCHNEPRFIEAYFEYRPIQPVKATES